MALAVRKIEIGKWKKNDPSNGAEACADAITNCLKTKDNKISIWEINDEPNVDDAVIAIVSKGDCLESIDIIQLKMEDIEEGGLKIEKSQGNTLLKEFTDKHREITDLTYATLGTLANIIIVSIKSQKNKRYTRSMLIQLVKSAVESGRISEEELKPSLKEQLKNREIS